MWRFTWCCVAWQFSGQSQDGDLLQLVLWRHRRVRRIMTYLIFNLIFLLEEEEITQLLPFDMTVRELKLWRRRWATRTTNKEKGYRDKRQTLEIYLPSLHDYDVKRPNTRFYGGHLFLGKNRIKMLGYRWHFPAKRFGNFKSLYNKLATLANTW